VNDTTTRTPERLRQHYVVERELADRLRNAPGEARGQLYAECYDELFRRVPDHPQLTRKADAAEQREAVEIRARLVEPLLSREARFLEVGPGDCSLSLRMCALAKEVYAVDVSAEITSQLSPPDNFHLLLSGGTDLPVPDKSIDVAFSYQLIEHLHPDDAEQHLAEVCRTLRPGGIYLCVTPNRLNGPHDISKYFDDVARGFHMREYTNGELSRLFRRAGFRRADPVITLGGGLITVPLSLLRGVEGTLKRLPSPVRRSLAAAPVMYRALGVTMRGTK
jgi:SAM-dependent methyltransferase